MKQNFDFLVKAEGELRDFSSFLVKWQKSVNLISPSTINQIWERHILDSAQLYPYIPTAATTLMDIGSGAGLPGIVLAILNKNLNSPLGEITLVESDKKKCIFLTEAARTFNLPVIVKNERIENITEKTDVLTARALADVRTLLQWSRGVRTPETTCLFLKGEKADQEILPIQDNFIIKKHPSLTNTNSWVLEIKEK